MTALIGIGALKVPRPEQFEGSATVRLDGPVEDLNRGNSFWLSGAASGGVRCSSERDRNSGAEPGKMFPVALTVPMVYSFGPTI